MVVCHSRTAATAVTPPEASTPARCVCVIGNPVSVCVLSVALSLVNVTLIFVPVVEKVRTDASGGAPVRGVEAFRASTRVVRVVYVPAGTCHL